MTAKNKRKGNFLIPAALGTLALLLFGFAFKPSKNDTGEGTDLDSPAPPNGGGSSGNTGSNSTSGASAGRSYQTSYSQAFFEKEIETRISTHYYKFTVQWIGGPNGSQMIVTSIDERPTPVSANMKIGTASGYLVKDNTTGEVYVHTLNNGVNMVTPLDDVKMLANPVQAGIVGAYTYYFDQSVKGKRAKALKSMSYQTFSASFINGPNGSVMQIGNISQQAKTWNPEQDMGTASGYIIESQGKKYLHTLKGSINYATLPVTGGILLI